MKIVSIKPAGVEPVYNMTVDKHHNYLIAGGLILKNCDAIRYFAQLRTLPPEMMQEEDEWDEPNKSSYEDYMCGGEPGAGYMAG